MERLHARVVEVLGELTGATHVGLLLWSEDRHEWLLGVTDSAGVTAIGDTDERRSIPLSVLRYVQRVPGAAGGGRCRPR